MLTQAHKFVSAINLADLLSQNRDIGFVPQGSDKLIVVTESRKRGIPDNYEGVHLVVTVYRASEYDAMRQGGSEAVALKADELSTDETMAAQLVATGIATRLSEFWGNGGNYRVSFNGPGAARRPYLHLHVLVLRSAENANLAWKPLVDPSTNFTVKVGD